MMMVKHVREPFMSHQNLGGNLGSDPDCEGVISGSEKGFIQPWIQFGRSATDSFYAISGFAISEKASKR